MEVHAHSHTSRKKWTHYFWEFLMLFLAVFCGFLAEYQLEHMIEKQREEQYMESLLSDLSADTAIFNTGIARKESRINAIDSAFVFFLNNKNVQSINGSFFKVLRRTTFDQRLSRSSITINQLKNAGGMRLIRKRDIADSIAKYDINYERYELYNEIYLPHQQLNFRHLEKMIPAEYMLQFYISNNTEAVVSNIPDNLAITINTGELNEYLNLLMQIKLYARQEINRLNQLKINAANLMVLIQKKYSLK